MSIATLQQVARQRLPLNVSDDDQVDELRVLMAAGLIAALPLRAPPKGDGGSAGPPMVRVLAITPDGRRLLESSAREAGMARAGAAQPSR